MILVTGTKRSGTSMWMQIMQAGGFPIFGEAFPRKWGETIRDANPAGFYESLLRQGIYHATNPHPRTGDYLFPEQVKGHVVKVFIPGVIRSDRAYIDRVVVTFRHWREYVRSIERLNAMEAEKRDPEKPDLGPRALSPLMEWWHENYSLIRDVVTRRYPVHFVAYETVLEDPKTHITAVLEWIGAGDSDAAAAVVTPELRTQEKPEVDTDLPKWVLDTFDTLYEHIRFHKPLTKGFIDKLNQTNYYLLPGLREEKAEIVRSRRRRVAARSGAARSKSGGESSSSTS